MQQGIYFVTGTSGTGKSAILRELTTRGVATVGIDEEPGLVTWIHTATGTAVPRGAELTDEFLATHDWGCDLEALQAILHEKSRPVVICGTCDNFLEIMNIVDKTFILVCEPEVFLSRIETRVDNEFGKTEAANHAILGYYQRYRDTCVDKGAVSVDASVPLNDVTDTLIEQINKDQA